MALRLRHRISPAGACYRAAGWAHRRRTRPSVLVVEGDPLLHLFEGVLGELNSLHAVAALVSRGLLEGVERRLQVTDGIAHARLAISEGLVGETPEAEGGGGEDEGAAHGWLLGL